MQNSLLLREADEPTPTPLHPPNVTEAVDADAPKLQKGELQFLIVGVVEGARESVNGPRAAIDRSDSPDSVNRGFLEPAEWVGKQSKILRDNHQGRTTTRRYYERRSPRGRRTRRQTAGVGVTSRRRLPASFIEKRPK